MKLAIVQLIASLGLLIASLALQTALLAALATIARLKKELADVNKVVGKYTEATAAGNEEKKS